MADQEFHLAARTALLSFIVVFGVAKALTNYGAGRLSDRYGRKHVLVAGWLVAVPVPFLLMWAPTWGWVLFANVLLGINQGLAWSMTQTSKLDITRAAFTGGESTYSYVPAFDAPFAERHERVWDWAE